MDTVRKAVKAAVMNGFVFDKVERKRLLKCEFTERFRKIIRTMEDKVAYETNNRMLAELDRSQD